MVGLVWARPPNLSTAIATSNAQNFYLLVETMIMICYCVSIKVIQNLQHIQPVEGRILRIFRNLVPVVLDNSHLPLQAHIPIHMSDKRDKSGNFCPRLVFTKLVRFEAKVLTHPRDKHDLHP